MKDYPLNNNIPYIMHDLYFDINLDDLEEV